MDVEPMEVKDETYQPMVFVASVSVLAQAVAQKAVSSVDPAHYHVAGRVVESDGVPSTEYQRALAAKTLEDH
jgi:hypothetical protein